MSYIERPHTEVHPDTMTSSVLIEILDDDVSVEAEEVIRYLESSGLAARTRQKIQVIVEVACERGVALRVRFKESWNCLWELDVLDALRALFAQKGFYQCV